MKMILVFSFMLFCSIANSQGSYPKASIQNKLIKAESPLPDPINGYYRGARFDWSGQISSLKWKGHEYFGQWFESYRPTLHDAIMGPVEAFAPIGYESAKPGEPFLVIGIGMVNKVDEPRYSIATEYPIVNSGKWKVKSKKDRIQYNQLFSDKGYAYEYDKVISLTKNKPELVLSHTLKNTGTQILETTVYNHNFFVMDQTLIGPAYEVKFPYPVSGTPREGADLVTVEGNRIQFVKDMVPKKYLYFTDIERHNNGNPDYNFSIENHKSGAAVKISCDRPIFKLPMWSAIKTVCPEPFLKFSLKPGDTYTWTIKYEFYECEVR
jgi:hypothetical protein